MKRSMILGLLASIALAGSLSAASDYLLELDGIKGESKDTVRPDTIEIESFTWGATNSGAFAGSGGGTGKVSFSDLHFVTRMSKASPKLFLACASGQHIKEAKLFVRKAGTTQEYYQVVLTDVLVSSYQSGDAPAASGDSRPSETLSVNFTAVKFSHIADDGTVTTAEAVRTPVQ